MVKVVPRANFHIRKSHDDKTKCITPSFQSMASVGNLEWSLLPIQPSAPTNAFSNAPKTIHYDLEPYDCQQIEHLLVRFKVSASGGDVQLAGSPFFFSEWKISSDKGSGSTLYKCYPEMILAWCMLTMNDECQQEWAKLMNFSLKDLKHANQKKYWYDDTNYIRDGESKYIYLPLPLNFISFKALDMHHISNPIRFTYETSSDIVINGDASNLSLDGIDFFITGYNESQEDKAGRQAIARKTDHCYNFLSADRLQVNTKTLTSATKTEIYLDNFVAKSPFLLICVKGSTNPTISNGSLFNYLELGKNATFTIENTSGRDLLSNGNPINQQQMYTHLNEQIGRKPFKGFNLLCFTDNIRSALAGTIQGYFQFNGQRLRLALVPDTAPTQETHSISLGTTASSGTYRYSFTNDTTIYDGDCDYNDSTSDLLTSLNNLPCLKDINITASSINNNLASTTSHNITFSTNAGRISDEFGKLTLIGNGIPKVNSTSITTYGDDGWTTSSDVQIEIFCFKWERFIVNKDGSLDTEVL